MKISTPTLPAEIRDIIIDCLHDDKKTLSACSRVSKSWRTRSQYHIFRILTITVDGPPWPPWDLAAYNRNLPPRPYPKQSQLVQELRINGLPSDATVGHTGTAALICSLQQLRVLDINNVYLFGEGSPLVYTSNLFRVLPHLAELRALRLHDIGCESSMREVKTNPSVRCRSGLDLTPLSFARLEELVVSGASFAPHRICQLLDEIASAHKRFETAQRKPPGFCGLRRATLGYVFGEYDADIRKSILFGSYGHLLKVAGTSLEHLSICFFGTTFGGDVIGIDLEASIGICKRIHVSACRRLKSLTLSVPVHYGFAANDAPWLAAAACLRLLPPDAPLESLTLVIHGRFFCGNPNFKAQRAVLRHFDEAACALRALRRVTITGSDSRYDLHCMSEPFFVTAKAQLPKLQEKVEFMVTDVEGRVY